MYLTQQHKSAYKRKKKDCNLVCGFQPSLRIICMFLVSKHTFRLYRLLFEIAQRISIPKKFSILIGKNGWGWLEMKSQSHLNFVWSCLSEVHKIKNKHHLQTSTTELFLSVTFQLSDCHFHGNLIHKSISFGFNLQATQREWCVCLSILT